MEKQQLKWSKQTAVEISDESIRDQVKTTSSKQFNEILYVNILFCFV